MARIISHSVLEEIRLGNDIATVIGSYFNLQHRGSTLKALCPFHKEKTPSFVVNPQRQIFHCFGCGMGGDVFRFVMDYEKVDFITAVKMLAQRAGIRLSLEDDRRSDKPGKDALYEIHEKVAGLYHQILLKNTEAGGARRYLRARGFSKPVVEEFMVGFAPDRWDTVLNWAGKQYKLEQLEAAGLIMTSGSGSGRDGASSQSGTSDQVSATGRDEGEKAVAKRRTREKEPHYYDRFRNRVVFPVQDEQGRVVGFSGRTMDESSETAKYINTPETAVFHKGRILYGLHKARRAIVQAREAVICEGQIDVIRCHLAGFKTAVAPQGTAFTDDHARILKRYADSAVLVFDADSAGQNAALRAADTLLKVGMAVRIASLPAGEDPDSLIRRSDGVSAFQGVLLAAKSALDFQIDILGMRETLDAEVGLLRAASVVLEMIHRTPNAVQQDMLLQRAAERLGLSEDALRKEFQKLTARRRAPEGRPDAESVHAGGQPIREVALAEHLIADPSLANLVRTYLPLEMVTDPVCRQIVQAAIESSETGGDILSMVSKRDTEERELSRFAARILAAPAKVKGGVATNEESVQSLILGIRTGAIQRRRKELERAQAESRLGHKLSASDRKALEMEYCQLGYDIAKLKRWETALPIMEDVKGAEE